MKQLFIIIFTIILASCAGSPARMAVQNDEQTFNDLIANKSLPQLCSYMTRHMEDRRKMKESFNKWWLDVNKLIDRGFKKYETTRNYCDNPADYEYNRIWSKDDFNIDGLLISVEKRRSQPKTCSLGNITKITLKGIIGPDSSFAIENLMKKNMPCSDAKGKVIHPVKVQLESNGGLIYDGYVLGRTLRKFGATTVINNGKVCASSCAVAFLGGKNRIIENTGTILFHSPYFNRFNAIGKPEANCKVDNEVLTDLEKFYTEMTSKEVGARLFETTMWYCSTEEGWTVTGGNAARLYGIATE